MRILICFLLTSLGSLSADFEMLVANNKSTSSSQPSRSSKKITLAKGDVATVKYLSRNAFLDVRANNTLVRLDANNPEQANLPTIAGPATIELLNFDSYNAALTTISIDRAGSATATPSTPHNVVVIPNDNSGDHNVYLESSSDMVTWTAVQPGVFNSQTANRFFRVRIAK